MEASSTLEREISNDLKRCSFCKEVILSDAKKCKHCQELLDPKLRAETALAIPQLKWNPAIAATISLLIPGGGHVYRGKVISGCLWAFFVAIGYGSYILQSKR